MRRPHQLCPPTRVPPRSPALPPPPAPPQDVYPSIAEDLDDPAWVGTIFVPSSEYLALPALQHRVERQGAWVDARPPGPPPPPCLQTPPWTWLGEPTGRATLRASSPLHPTARTSAAASKRWVGARCRMCHPAPAPLAPAVAPPSICRAHSNLAFLLPLAAPAAALGHPDAQIVEYHVVPGEAWTYAQLAALLPAGGGAVNISTLLGQKVSTVSLPSPCPLPWNLSPQTRRPLPLPRRRWS